MPAPIKTTGSAHIGGVASRQPLATAERLAELVRAHRQPAAPALRKAEQAVWARLDTASSSLHAAALFPVPSVLGTTPHACREPDEPAARRLRELAEHLDALGTAFPAIRTDIALCRHTCELLEAAWRTRADHGDQPARSDGQSCGCALCACLPDAPARQPEGARDHVAAPDEIDREQFGRVALAGERSRAGPTSSARSSRLVLRSAAMAA